MNLLPDLSFINIFSPSGACLLILLTLIFQSRSSDFSEVQLIIFFMDHAFGVVSKQSLPMPRSSRFCLMLSSRSFIVLCFMVRSVIYL